MGTSDTDVASGAEAVGTLRAKSASAAFLASPYPFAWLLWPDLKMPTSKNDGSTRSLSAPSPDGERIGVDLEERFLNSILKGRMVGRIGPLVMHDSLMRRGSGELHYLELRSIPATRSVAESVMRQEPYLCVNGDDTPFRVFRNVRGANNSACECECGAFSDSGRKDNASRAMTTTIRQGMPPGQISVACL